MGFFDKYKINRALRSVGDYDLDDILERFGLERRSVAGSVATGIGFFALGALAGALAGVLFAPGEGAETRETVKKAIQDKKWMGGMGEMARHQPAGEA